jgi:hypothetical protein
MVCFWQRARAASGRLCLVVGLLAAAIIAGCDEAPTAGAQKTLADVCDHANDGKRVALDGYLSLPSSFTEGASSGSAPVVIRGDVPESGDVTFVWVPYGSGPNAMEKVPDTYSQRDLKVYTKEGASVGYRDKVRISGTVTFPSRRPYEVNTQGGRLLDCGLNNPLIERL